MLVSEAIVEILGAGLAPATREAIKGELDGYRRPHRSGRPVCDRELLPIAVTVTVAARFRPANAKHLPTLVSLGGLSLVASQAIFIVAGLMEVGQPESWMAGYLISGVAMGALAGTCLCRRVPTRAAAAASCLFGVNHVFQLLTATPDTAADRVAYALNCVFALVVPFLFVSLAWRCRHDGCAWSELPGVLRSGPLTRAASRAVTYVFAATAVVHVLELVVAGPEIVLLDRIGAVIQVLGLVLLWAGFRSAMARSAT